VGGKQLFEADLIQKGGTQGAAFVCAVFFGAPFWMPPFLMPKSATAYHPY
jgi:hypothetical protein